MAESKEKKKYRVNLPKTPFSMKAGLATREPERLKLWQDEAVEKRLLETVKKRDQKFILHDGPPYANGNIHIGHALNKVMKDVIVKFKTMQGFNTHYVPGWDCHGLPIEHACLKELGKRKDEVERVEFRKTARAYAKKHIEAQREDFKRLGIFADWENPYLTMNFHYQASIVKAFWEIYEKGFIEQRLKPVPWCFDCETALADAELEYEDKKDPAIFVKFPVLDPKSLSNQGSRPDWMDEESLKSRPFSYLVWTTTPWTLPANVGLALNPDLDYLAVEVGDEGYIFAEGLLEKIAPLLGLELPLKAVHRRGTFKGKDLEGKFEAKHPFLERNSKIIMADYVSAEDGTGIVHIAPGHGEDDYQHGFLQNKLEIISPVDEKGRFFEDTLSGFVKQYPDYNNLHIFKGNKQIVELLREKGALLHDENYTHSYPHCWRCKKPILYRATPQWFMKVDHENLRTRITDEIQNKIKFYPDWGKNRIGTMIETRPDWCLSRQRLWGVPIPLAVNKKTGEVHLSEKFKARVLELFENEGADAWFKRPKEDFFPEESEVAAQVELQEDILDVWFDSGVSHQAVLETGHDLGFPADLYLEGSDQHRGWFQTSLISSVALRGKSAYKSVLTHGFVMGKEGKKMSKSLGNVVSPQDVMKKYGADILRLWVSSCDTDKDVRLGSEILDRMAEAYRKIRNTFRYMLGNLDGFDPTKHKVTFEEMESIDKWAITKLNSVANEVTQAYENFRFLKIYQTIYDFCISDLSSFYLDALKDRLYCDPSETPERRSAQSAFFILTKALSQLLAPILVFTMDEVWRSFSFGDEKSIHEAAWDKDLWERTNPSALHKWNTIREIRKVSDGVIEKMRESKDVGSSLDCQVILETDSAELQAFIETNLTELELGMIVSKLTLGDSGTSALSSEIAWTSEAGADRTDTLKLTVVKAAGEKCARCWKYRPEVGSQSDPALCERCNKAEEQLPVDQPS